MTRPTAEDQIPSEADAVMQVGVIKAGSLTLG